MTKPQLGLKENLLQFVLLVIVNAFVGGMIGMERSILPQLAEEEFQIAAKTAILSFIIVFGIFKAISNYLMGTLANRFGRKNLLVTGWLIGAPVPLILIYADSWEWVIFANILLGINQGLSWSSTVIMKIDIVGTRNRGLAMGLNEFAGYIAVAAIAFLTGYIAGEYGIRPYPFYLGVGLVILGLLTSIFLIKDTGLHVQQESGESNIRKLQNIFAETSWKDSNLGAVTQAGLINNLNDGMMWGLLPIILAIKGFNLEQIGMVTAAYPAVWGIGQLFTGKMADHFDKKKILYIGMFLQGITLLIIPIAVTFIQFLALAATLGFGTAMVYPTFMATIAQLTHPLDRAKSLGVFRFWRDIGYAVGALVTGVLADLAGVDAPVYFIGALTIFSAAFILFRMRNG